MAKPSPQGGYRSRVRRAVVRFAVAGGLLLGSWLAGANTAFAADELDDAALVPELVAAVEQTELVPELIGLLEPEDSPLEMTGLLPAEPVLPDIAAAALLSTTDPEQTGTEEARAEEIAADTAPPPAPDSAPPAVEPPRAAPAPESNAEPADANPGGTSAPEPAAPATEHHDDLPPLPELPAPLTTMTATGGQGGAAFRPASAVLPPDPAAPQLPRTPLGTSEPRIALLEASYDQPDFPD